MLDRPDPLPHLAQRGGYARLIFRLVVTEQRACVPAACMLCIRLLVWRSLTPPSKIGKGIPIFEGGLRLRQTIRLCGVYVCMYVLCYCACCYLCYKVSGVSEIIFAGAKNAAPKGSLALHLHRNPLYAGDTSRRMCSMSPLSPARLA